jgi:hypothetical protein
MDKINEIQSIEKYMMFLNDAPKKFEVNKLARGAKYVPIGEVEKTLDELYLGLWSTENFNYQVVANEIVGSIDLKVFHPITQTWITRIGAAAVQIMVQKDQPAEMQYKIKNALETGFPKLKAECVKNAARSLGVIFGRNLNRKATSNGETLTQKLIKQGKLLTAESPTFLAAQKALIEKTVTIEQIEKKYQLTEQAKLLLTQNIKENETV